MFEKYRGLVLTSIFIAAIVYLGYRNEQRLDNSIHRILKEEKAASATDNTSDNAVDSSKHAVHTEEHQAPELTPSQVEEIVRSYLIKNPQVIADALDNLQKIKTEEMRRHVQEQISTHKSDLENSSSPVLGNHKGKSIIVMFYDYNCGYCKQSSDAVESILSTNSDVKVVLKIYPILGNESEFLAKLMMALNMHAPEKFKAIHNELLSNKVFHKDDLIHLFKEHGLNFDNIEKLSESEEVANQIKNNLALAKDLRINGVPAFVINGSYYPGFLTAEQLIEKTKLPSMHDADKAPGFDTESIEHKEIEPAKDVQ